MRNNGSKPALSVAFLTNLGRMVVETASWQEHCLPYMLLVRQQQGHFG